MFYNYSTVKLILLLTAKFQELFFIDYIFKAHLNSLCENQCRPVLEIAVLAVTIYSLRDLQHISIY